MIVVSEVLLIIEVMLVFPVPEFDKLLQTVLTELGQDVDIQLFILG